MTDLKILLVTQKTIEDYVVPITEGAVYVYYHESVIVEKNAEIAVIRRALENVCAALEAELAQSFSDVDVSVEHVIAQAGAELAKEGK